MLFKKKHTKKFPSISYEHVATFGKEFFTFVLVLICTFYFVIKFMAVLFDINYNPTKTTNNATAAGTITMTTGVDGFSAFS